MLFQVNIVIEFNRSNIYDKVEITVDGTHYILGWVENVQIFRTEEYEEKKH